MNARIGLKPSPAGDMPLSQYLSVVEPSTGMPSSDAVMQYWGAIVPRSRAYAVTDASRVVATCLSEPLELTVPASTCKMVGLECGFVAPDYRRLGLLSALIRQLLDDAREQEIGLAAGWPSESVIHGRFEMAPATTATRLFIERQDARLLQVQEGTPQGTTRLIEADQAASTLAPIYDRARLKTAGMVARSPERWTVWAHQDPPDWQDPTWQHDVGPRTFVAWEDRAYAAYRLQRRWGIGGPDYRLLLAELVAADDEAYRAVWQWCLNVDLTRSLLSTLRPADEPLRLMLADHRRLHVQSYDGMWLRLVDVPRAFESREYAIDGRCIIRTRDQFGPWAAGTYELVVEGGRAQCNATRKAPDVILPASSLAAAYLGNTRLQTLKRAGRVDEDAPLALALLDMMLTTEPLPWTPWLF